MLFRSIGAPGFTIGGDSDASYNSLVTSDRVDPISGAPAVRSLCCEVRPVAGAEGERWAGLRTLRVVARRQVAPEITALTVAAEDGRPLAGFTAGQFLSLRPLQGVPTGTIRSYSLIGRPAAAPTEYQVAIRRIADGRLSALLSMLQPGDLVEASIPTGHFTLPFENEFPVVLIASGIGITPFMSALEQLAARGGPETWLYYGSRNGEHHAFKERIDEIARATPRLTVRNFYSRPGPSEAQPHRVGRLAVAHLDPELLRRRARFYMCGPDDMLASFRADLAARGVPKFEIFYERFAAARDKIAGELKPASIVLQRQQRTIAWSPQDGSILELAERQGVQLPAGCRTGQCESCAVRVLAGQVAHFVEVADDEPDTCLTCQAYPLTDLVLDI